MFGQVFVVADTSPASGDPRKSAFYNPASGTNPLPMILALNSSALVTLLRPTRSCFTFFQTYSSRLSCGE